MQALTLSQRLDAVQQFNMYKSYIKRYGVDLEVFDWLIPKDGYKQIGEYKVKETFAGDESLTQLLTRYVERTVSLKY